MKTYFKILLIVFGASVNELVFNRIGESMLIMNMMVPSHVEQGSDVTLYCFYNLESDFSLYSIKWYKDSQGTLISIRTNVIID